MLVWPSSLVPSCQVVVSARAPTGYTPLCFPEFEALRARQGPFWARKGPLARKGPPRAEFRETLFPALAVCAWPSAGVRPKEHSRGELWLHLWGLDAAPEERPHEQESPPSARARMWRRASALCRSAGLQTPSKIDKKQAKHTHTHTNKKRPPKNVWFRPRGTSDLGAGSIAKPSYQNRKRSTRTGSALLELVLVSPCFRTL